MTQHERLWDHLINFFFFLGVTFCLKAVVSNMVFFFFLMWSVLGIHLFLHCASLCSMFFILKAKVTTKHCLP